MYFDAKRTELPWRVFRLQKTFRGYNVQAKPQHDSVAAIPAAILGCTNGSERQEVCWLILCIAETHTRTCSLGFHFWEGCSDVRVQWVPVINSWRWQRWQTSSAQLCRKEYREVAWLGEALRGRNYQGIQNCLIWWINDARQKRYSEAEMRQM